MTPAEVIDDVILMGQPVELHIVLRYIADHHHELTLTDGSPLRDATDYKLFFLELALAAKMARIVQ